MYVHVCVCVFVSVCKLWGRQRNNKEATNILYAIIVGPLFGRGLYLRKYDT